MTLAKICSKLFSRKKQVCRKELRSSFRPKIETLEDRLLMAFAAITGDNDGSIYALERTGEVRWYKDTARDGTQAFNAPNERNVVDTDWRGYDRVFSGGDGIIYAIDKTGNLHWHRDLLRDGTAVSGGISASFSSPNDGNVIGVGWGGFSQVFYGGQGIIYAVEPNGDLRWYKDVLRDGSGFVGNVATSFTAPNEGAIIGHGFNAFNEIVASDNGSIYAIQPNGSMLWYKDLARNGTAQFSPLSSAVVNTGFVGYDVFIGGYAPTGERVMYAAHQPDGNMYLFKFSESSTPSVFANGGNGWLVQAGFVTSYLEGYGANQSVIAGQRMQFYVGSTVPYTVQFEKLHSTFDANGMPIPGSFSTVMYADPSVHAAHPREIPLRAYEGAGWEKNSLGSPVAGNFELPDTTLWKSGIYAAHLVGNGFSVYIPFVIKPSSNGKHAPHAIMVNTATWNAYNNWGGHSSYDLSDIDFGYGAVPEELGVVPLSFMRPNPAASPIENAHLLQGELWTSSFLEDQGYQFDYYTDYDLHQGINGINYVAPGSSRYASLILSTHPEYYSIQEKANLEAYVRGDATMGGSLLYLGGNGVFQAVHYDEDDPNKMDVRYYGRTRRENWFRNIPFDQTERSILGVASQWDPGPSETAAYKIRPELALVHPFFYGTIIFSDSQGDLVVGERVGPLGKASGWETDQAFNPVAGIPLYPSSGTFLGYGGATVPNVQVLAHGKLMTTDPVTGLVYDEGADMTYYETHPLRGVDGGFVFSAGSITFGSSMLVDYNLKMIVKNALNKAIEINSPKITVSGPSSYVENAAPLLFASTSLLTDQNSPNFADGFLTVSIVQGMAITDQLAIRNVGVAPTQIGISGANVTYGGIIIGRWSGGIGGVPLMVRLNSNANLVNTQALIRSLTFLTTGENPSAASRLVLISLLDGDGGASNGLAREIRVVPVNDRPVVSNFGPEVIYTENASPVQLSFTSSVIDVDSANFDTGRLIARLSLNGTASDRLTVRNQGQISIDLGNQILFAGIPIGSAAGGSGVTPLTITLNAQATPARVQQLMRALYFETVNENPSTAPRTLSVTLGDGDGGTSLAVSKSILVNAVNDAPSLTNLGPTLRYTNNAAKIAISSTALVADPDSVNFDTGVLSVHASAGANASNRIEVSGTDFIVDLNRNVIRVDAVLGNLIVGTLNVGGGIGLTSFDVTLNANATAPIVQRLVRSLRFRTQGNNNFGDRVIEFSLTDGDGGSIVQSKTIQII